MPAIFDSLVTSQGLTAHKAWRVAYIVPFIIITTVALGMLFLCEDTPTGKWSERHLWAEEANANSYLTDGKIVDLSSGSPSVGPSGPPSIHKSNMTIDMEKTGGTQSPSQTQTSDREASPLGQIAGYRQDLIVAPTRREALSVAFSLPTMAVAVPYACSFGAELALDSFLGTYYAANFPGMGQTESGRWAAMFGLLNIVFRPAGGFMADMVFSATGSLWSKKLLIVFLGVVMGAFMLAIGLTNPSDQATMFGLIAGMAFFLEAANGANFGLVPHVHPYANGEITWLPLHWYAYANIRLGIVSGLVGGFGNLGGIIFAIIFRYNESHYGRSIWIMGAISLVANVAVSWIRPIAKTAVIQ